MTLVVSTPSRSVPSDSEFESRSGSESEQEKSESYSGAAVMSRKGRGGRGERYGDWVVEAKGDCSHVGQCASEEALYNQLEMWSRQKTLPQHRILRGFVGCSKHIPHVEFPFPSACRNLTAR